LSSKLDPLLKKIASITPAASKGSQLTRHARYPHAELIFLVTEGVMITEEFLATVAYVLKGASKNRREQKEEANRSTTGGGLLAVS